MGSLVLTVFDISCDVLELEDPNTFSINPEKSDDNLSTISDDTASNRSSDIQPQLSQLTQPPCSLDQVVSSVKNIYAVLSRVEVKCKDMHEQHFKRPTLKPTDSYWQSWVWAHRTLIQQHYDLYLACQHPIAPLTLAELIAKYSLP